MRMVFQAGIGLAGAAALLVGGAKLTGSFLPSGETAALTLVTGSPPQSDIFVFDLERGLSYNLTHSPESDWYPALSPDGTRLAFSANSGGNVDIYVVDVQTSQRLRLTDDPAFDGEAAWSPDGEQLVFVSKRDNNRDLYLVDTAGGRLRRLTDDVSLEASPAWSPDGTRIAYVSTTEFDPAEVFVLALDCNEPDGICGRQAQRLTIQPGYDMSPAWSPDGHSIAFVSDRGGGMDVYVMGTDCLERDSPCFQNARQMSNGHSPVKFDLWWTPDGEQLRFVASRSITGANPDIYALDSDCDRCAPRPLTRTAALS